jgi:hypothetical protein
MAQGTEVDPKALQLVAEDLEWLQAAWAVDPDKLSDADVRRGGATIRRLLLERGQGAILKAWRAMGFEKQPLVTGPDLLALLDQLHRPVEHVVSAVAGGVPVNGIEIVALGLHRVRHPKTGVPPDAEEGFAVEVSSVARNLTRAGEVPTPSPYDANINRVWRLAEHAKNTEINNNRI